MRMVSHSLIEVLYVFMLWLNLLWSKQE